MSRQRREPETRGERAEGSRVTKRANLKSPCEGLARMIELTYPSALLGRSHAISDVGQYKRGRTGGNRSVSYQLLPSTVRSVQWPNPDPNIRAWDPSSHRNILGRRFRFGSGSVPSRRLGLVGGAFSNYKRPQHVPSIAPITPGKLAIFRKQSRNMPN